VDTKPKILITNDDSISAPGIWHLWNAVKNHYETCIVAPKFEQSGKGLGITLHEALHIDPVSWDNDCPAFSVTGTPADCIKLAASIILPHPPDLIISGINRGCNAGRTVLYSGTIGGVIEGVLRGISGIAFSSFDIADTEYTLFEPYIAEIVDFVIKHPMPSGTLLNVNFPSKHVLQALNLEIPPGIKLTRQGKQYWIEDPLKHASADSAYMLGTKLKSFDELSESEIYWLEKGYIACVPIHVDELSDFRYIRAQEQAFETHFSAKSMTAK